MTPDAWITLAVVAAILIGLAREVAPPSVLIFVGVVVLLISGVVDASEAFAGFSNPAPFTVAALFVVARAVSKTGAIRPLTRSMMGDVGHTRRPMLRMLFPTALSSGFLNNTPLVAMLIPEVTAWARRRGSDVSKFLLPLSYGAILGGLVTLIGTSTNLVIAGQMGEVGLEPFSFFELGAVGLPIAIVGIVILVAISPRLLASKQSSAAGFREDTRKFTIELEVVPGGPVDGKTVEEAKLRHLSDVFLASIDRGDTTIAPARPNTVLRGGNLLRFVGEVSQILDLQNLAGVRLAEHRHLSEMESPSARFFQVVVAPDSPFVGKTLSEAQFRSQYQAAVVAIHRAGHRLEGKLGEMPIRVGDAFLVVADPEFKDRWQNRSDFLIIASLDDELSPPARGGGVTIVILVGMILVAALNIVPILEASLAAVVLLLAMRILTPDEARRAVDLEVIGVIASAFGLAAAMQASGLADLIADGIVTLFQGIGPTGVLLGIVIATVALTELVTNNAAALLMFPIAITGANAAAIDPRGMAVAVAISASASFLTPIGYQTNTMVYGPGGYNIKDYIKTGAPLTLLVIVTVTLLVPVFYGL